MDEIQLVENDKPRRSGFKPGISGNPSGRPKSDRVLQELAKAHTTDAINALVEIFHSKRAPASARVKAACALLDRAWGKPHQYVETVNLGLTLQDCLRQFREEDEALKDDYFD